MEVHSTAASTIRNGDKASETDWNNNDMTKQTIFGASEDGISRRSVVAGAAWTVPVVAVAVAAPMAAASISLSDGLKFEPEEFYGLQPGSVVSGIKARLVVNGQLAGNDQTIYMDLANSYIAATSSTIAPGDILFADGSSTFVGTFSAGYVDIPPIVLGPNIYLGTVQVYGLNSVGGAGVFVLYVS